MKKFIFALEILVLSFFTPSGKMKKVAALIAIVCLCMSFKPQCSILAKETTGVLQKEKETNELSQIIANFNSLVGATKESIIVKLGEPKEKFLDLFYNYPDKKLTITFNENLVWAVYYEHPSLEKFTFPEVEKILGKPSRHFKDGNKIYVSYNKGKYHHIQLVFKSNKLTEVKLGDLS
jgi:hypothetical protein